MRVALATVLAALAGAAPATAVTGGFGVANALRGGYLSLAKSDSSAPKTRTCQAGKHKGGVTKSTLLIGEKGKPGVVACEQPPRSEFSPDAIAKATAAALAVFG